MNDGTLAFDAILDTCLDALLAGDWTLEHCLQQYPDHAADLKPALQMALLTTRLTQPEMSASSVAALEMRLKGQMVAQHSRRRSTPALLPMSRLVATIAIVMLLTVGTGGGIVAASANAMPGDWLYGLKRLWEGIILALSGLTSSSGTTWLHLAEVRLDEAEELARRGIIDENVLVDLYEATANTLLLADNGSQPQIIAYITDARIRLIDLPVNASTAAVHVDLMNLLSAENGLQRPAFTSPPSLIPALATLPPPSATPTMTLTATHTATLTPTATATVTDTATPREMNTTAPSATPTSRVSATATDTRVPSRTPAATVTASITPTLTWTPVPLPLLPTADLSGPQQTRQPGGSGSSSTAIPPTADATIRYRETLAILISTLTAQATMATEEVEP